MAEVPKIVTRRLREAVVVDTHPNEDVLSAFAENALADGERTKVLQHLSRCIDCRDVVALALPELDASEQIVAGRAQNAWLSWPVLRWGALAACLVVVGAAVTMRYRERVQPAVSAPVANTEVAELKAPAPEQSSADQKTLDDSKVPAAAVAKKTPPANPGKTRDRLQADDLRASNAVTAEKVQAAPASTASSETSTTAEVTGIAPVTEADEMQNVPGRAKGEIGGGIMGKQRMAMAAVAAPNNGNLSLTGSMPRWTLTSNGMLQRSSDSGRTWQAIAVPGQNKFRALSANGLEIWVGGSSGALYHSSDAGQNWTRVQPSVGTESLTADVTGVEFTDAVHGTVTTSANEMWTTEDAGVNWQRK